MESLLHLGGSLLLCWNLEPHTHLLKFVITWRLQLETTPHLLALIFNIEIANVVLASKVHFLSTNLHIHPTPKGLVEWEFGHN